MYNCLRQISRGAGKPSFCPNTIHKSRVPSHCAPAYFIATVIFKVSEVQAAVGNLQNGTAVTRRRMDAATTEAYSLNTLKLHRLCFAFKFT